MLSVVWDNSSDVIGISVRGVSGDVTTMLSPTYMKMYSVDSNDADRGTALAFDLDARCFKLGSGADVVPINIYDLHFKDLIPGGKHFKSSKSQSLGEEETISIAKLVVRSWKSNEPKSLLMHDLVRTRGTPEVNIRCEANITRMEKNSLVIVMRDISERFKRFEAEKKVISETTARLKDAAANRFTRHEVKNGLLAAIGLCDSLNESILKKKPFQIEPEDAEETKSTIRIEPEDAEETTSTIGCKNDIQDEGKSQVTNYLFELNKTLHEILDTILAEAMARDVVHEVYEPKLERVDVPGLLADIMNHNSSKASFRRFPITTSPSPLPNYALDPQLLKYIHRNAISNACKYGKKGGIVSTNVKYEAGRGMLKMEVVNQPGKHHLEILKLGKLAQELVLSPRQRLEVHCTEDSNNQVSASHSSGDGAWIMHKCAKTLRGTCGIKFEIDKTTFSFDCPVKLFNENLANTNIKYEDFKLPKNLQAVAIDDSNIQRKLLSRFFMFAGVPVDNIHVLGATAKEINEFCDWSITFVDEHPDDYILMIVDENLDVQEEQVGTNQSTVSGSGSVAEIRKRLLVNQERKILALIRSANDSSSDVAIYNSRAHGYLAKNPVKKDHVLETLAPLWLKRFPKFEISKSQSSTGDNRRTAVDELIVTMDDLMGLVNEIDDFSLLAKDDLDVKWCIIWEKLHALKGDLLIMSNRSYSLDAAISAIGYLRGPLPPDNFIESWAMIRSNLMKGGI
jgi:signal transduction histidine kinase